MAPPENRPPGGPDDPVSRRPQDAGDGAAARKIAAHGRLNRARRILAIGLLITALLVLGVYLLGRRQAARTQRAADLKIPALGLTIQQSAHGVTVSKDNGGRPVFRVYAQRAETMRGTGEDRLFGVRILAYNADGVFADEIRGDAFAYNQRTGQLTAAGLVHIRLQDGPRRGRDAAAGSVVANAVQVEARDLSYNVKTGLGVIGDGLNFTYVKATGQAAQGRLNSRAGWLTLGGGVRVQWTRDGGAAVVVTSERARLQREPGMPRGAPSRSRQKALPPMRLILEDHAQLNAGAQSLTADTLVFNMRADQTLSGFDAHGHVHAIDTGGRRRVVVTSDAAQARFIAVARQQTAIDHLDLSGHVALDEASNAGQYRLNAGQVDCVFNGRHQLTEMRALDGARLVSSNRPVGSDGGRGRYTGRQVVTAPELDLHLANEGRSPAPGSLRLTELAAIGGAALDLTPPGQSPVHATASRFELMFDARQQPATATARGEVMVVQTVAGVRRTSRSDRLAMKFATPATPAGAAQLERVVAQGRVTIHEGERSLTADRVADDLGSGRAVLSADVGSPFSHGLVRGSDAGTRFTAPEVVWTKAADGGNELVASGGIALNRSTTAVMDSQLPVVITAQRLDWRQPPPAAPRSAGAAPLMPGFTGTLPGVATFLGKVRLLQYPNLLRADRLVVDGAGTLLAEGGVSAEFVSSAKSLAGAERMAGSSSKVAPAMGRLIRVSANQLEFNQRQNRARFVGHVVMRSGDMNLTAAQLVLTLTPATSASGGRAALQGAGAAKLQSADALGGVRITQPGREATAKLAHVDFLDQEATLSGGPPSIFDAEQGQISGDPLTFSMANDEIQVGSKTGGRASGHTELRK